jgi:hypothetical protein
MKVEEYRKIFIQKYGKETIKDIQDNLVDYLNEYSSGCSDGTFREQEYNLQNEIENEMKKDFYDDDYLDTDTINNLNTFTNILIKGARRYGNKKETRNKHQRTQTKIQ